MAAAGLTPGEQADNIKSLRDFLFQYNNVSEECFMACVNDFGSRTVSKQEEKCTQNCLDKYLRITQRLALRFQEHQMIMQEAMGSTTK